MSLNDELIEITRSQQMARQSVKLVEPITGYFITITDHSDGSGDIIHESELKLRKVGGAHVHGVADLIMIIEDAVFTAEQEHEKNS